MHRTAYFLVATAMAGLISCGQTARLKPEAGMGARPVLPPPQTALIPTVKVAKAVGWPEGGSPQAASGLAVRAFARGLDHPRWLYVLPNGDVLVAETNAPSRGARSGIRAWLTKLFMKRAGAGTPSADRITLLRDTDGDGMADIRHVFLQGLYSPFGMALVNGDFYVANTDALMQYPYREGDTQILAEGRKIADLPAGPINYHWTKSLLLSPDGRLAYVGVGSNSNVGEQGMENERERAAILEIDLATGAKRLYASGLRNPVGLARHPQTGELWAVVNERDELGSDLVPDYLTMVREHGFYGWPYSYYGQHVDPRVKSPRMNLVERATVPDYALGAHVAALGLAFYDRALLPQQYRGGAFVGLHGSWNRKPLIGYKVVYVPFTDGKPRDLPEDVLTGFVNARDEAYGRPVGLAVDKAGALLVADDVGNTVWRVTPAK